ncbi:hypothetical protein SNOG_10191 [Parastagonospora nodorum SN15]|uniref:Uncharacterized protein n=1 Tax=Phaeosphaeria nodorum (strain SN15 / ATCC MYA-4574 / FGSC 10173) TaxID=321614 RepID=Q0UDH3_PHANO|nr:hypothetical protein SNOG_10191 [Parastagonospora nodorum SN15]EAT82526.1 hypothetical protein SNOG_10191 [Parastagonospora nodorum SN15]
MAIMKLGTMSLRYTWRLLSILYADAGFSDHVRSISTTADIHKRHSNYVAEAAYRREDSQGGFGVTGSYHIDYKLESYVA